MYYYYYYYYENKPHNRIELHYWLKDNLHGMDALIQNHCEKEFLRLITTIAKNFKSEIYIDTEAVEKGGLRRFYNIVSKREGKEAIITASLITAIATCLITTPLSTTLEKLTEKIIEKVFEKEEKIALEKEKDSLYLVKLKQDILLNSIRLKKNKSIERFRYQFFKELEKHPTLEKVSFVVRDENYNSIVEEIYIDKNDFKNFAIENEEILEIKAIERLTVKKNEEIINTNIEILSPDFSSESLNWKGLYNGNQITFQIKDFKFNTKVQNSSLQFKKGSSINCNLVKQRNSINDYLFIVTNVNEFKQ